MWNAREIWNSSMVISEVNLASRTLKHGKLSHMFGLGN
jgi:hypothetical protein